MAPQTPHKFAPHMFFADSKFNQTSPISEMAPQTANKFAHHILCDASKVNQTPRDSSSEIEPQTPINFVPSQFFGLLPKPLISDPENENAPITPYFPHQKFFNVNEPVIQNPIPDPFDTLTNNRINEDELYLRRLDRQSSYGKNALIAAVFSALNFLEKEKMFPTKENIENFLRYSGSPNEYHNIDIDQALNLAIAYGYIIMQKLGESWLYINRHSSYLWECVIPDIGAYPDQYSEATWDAVQKFLSTLHGRTEIRFTDSRYEAALIMKSSCLPRLSLGRVIQILNMVIAKGWIEPAVSGWKPITITLARN